MPSSEQDFPKNRHYCEPGDRLVFTGLQLPEKPPIPKAEDKVGDVAVNIMFGFVFAVLAMMLLDALMGLYSAVVKLIF